jgi:hypothetical protein
MPLIDLAASSQVCTRYCAAKASIPLFRKSSHCANVERRRGLRPVEVVGTCGPRLRDTSPHSVWAIVAVVCSRQVCIYWLWKHCLLLPILPGDEQIHIRIGKPCRSRTCLVRIAGPCPAEAYECTSVRAYEPANSHRDAAYSQQLHCSSAFESSLAIRCRRL